MGSVLWVRVWAVLGGAGDHAGSAGNARDFGCVVIVGHALYINGDLILLRMVRNKSYAGAATENR